MALAMALLISLCAFALTSRDPLRHATSSDAIVWALETVDNSANSDWFTSIALDSNDRVHISYFDHMNTALMYATNAARIPEFGTAELVVIAIAPIPEMASMSQSRDPPSLSLNRHDAHRTISPKTTSATMNVTREVVGPTPSSLM